MINGFQAQQCPICGSELTIERKGIRNIKITVECPNCGILTEQNLTLKQLISQIVNALRQIPYFHLWILALIASVLLFSWYDELLIWGLAGVFLNPKIPLIYYFTEYIIFLPLIILLGYKTYKKMGIVQNFNEFKFYVKSIAKSVVKNSVPVLIYRKIKK